MVDFIAGAAAFALALYNSGWYALDTRQIAEYLEARLTLSLKEE